MASIYSVSQVNAYIKNMFSQDFALNRFNQGGGIQLQVPHLRPYLFYLERRAAAIQAVMFASRRKGASFSDAGRAAGGGEG